LFVIRDWIKATWTNGGVIEVNFARVCVSQFWAEGAQKAAKASNASLSIIKSMPKELKEPPELFEIIILALISSLFVVDCRGQMVHTPLCRANPFKM